MNQKIAFLDRDGVVNIDYGYVYRVADFEFTHDFFPACALLLEAGYRLVVVTNQSGIARGYYSEADFEVLTDWLKQQFIARGLVLDAVYHCPHGADSTCACRKPQPGMVLQHLAQTGAAAQDCIMFGDKGSDRACANAAGIGHFLMIDTQQNSRHFYESVHAFLDTTICSSKHLPRDAAT
jgi:D-glycero-D-manno-heptose 1,7-bisphosphate phosphatase